MYLVLAAAFFIACLGFAFWKLSKAPSGELRLDIVKMKLTGRLRMLSWSDVARMMVNSCGNWPSAEKLAIPKSFF